MRRSLTTSLLVLLVAISAVGPTAAKQPSPSPEPSPVVDPSTDPVPVPTAEPSDEAPAPSEVPSEAPSASAVPSDPVESQPAESAAPDPTPSASPSDAVTPPTPDPSQDPMSPTDPTGRYLVMVRAGTDLAAVVSRHRTREGTKVDRTFERAFRGFSAKLSKVQRTALLADPNVLAVVPDERIELAAQSTPTGISRVGTKLSDEAEIDNVDERVDADIAIVDTGVAKVADLNVAGGYNCSSSDRSKWRDVHGHGTHVAGTAAALDNNIGVVGVAPGARVWGVKILNDNGEGLLSGYVCGLDWILAQRDPEDPDRPLFEAVNMSVTKWGKDDGDCGASNNDILHAAICRLVAGGITVVVAAANDSGSAAARVPAAYNEVITVSALADTDGKAGAVGGNRCFSWGSYDSDDTFANFSNYGSDVDIMAPGKCIWSTMDDGTYAYMSGTSMASPTVAGAVALYKASRPTATPADVKEALRQLGNLNWRTSTDPDGNPDILLDVSRVGRLGQWSFRAGTPSVSITDGGGTVQLPIVIDRTATHFERVRFSVSDLPSGWSASWAPSSLIGFTSRTAGLNVTVPNGTRQGTYALTVTGNALGQTDTTTALVVVGPGATWHAVTPTRRLDTRYGTGLSGRFRSATVRSFAVSGAAGIPSDAVAVTGNLTVTEATSAGYVTLGPSLAAHPKTSTINVGRGQTIANGVTAQLAAGDLAAVYVGTTGSTAHVIFDVTGYYRADTSGATWYGLGPSRFLDTRSGVGLSGDFVDQQVRSVQLTGRRGLPSGAVAVTASVTIVGATGGGYLSIGPSMTSTPSTSTLNFRVGQTIANNVTLRIGSGGRVSAVIDGASTLRADVLLDVTGYYMNNDDGGHWYPVAPFRRLDTRVGTGLSGRFKDDVTRSFQVTGGPVPPDARAVTANLTATGPTAPGFVVAAPIISTTSTSTLNVGTGDTIANGLVLSVTASGRAGAEYNGPTGSSTHLILDVVGYFR